MSVTDVLLPKHVSDSCYASITQIYIDMFKVSSSSNLWTASSMKRGVANKKVFSLERSKKSKEPIEVTMRRSDRHLSRPVDVFEKNLKHRASWYLGQTKQIGDGATIEFVTKF